MLLLPESWMDDWPVIFGRKKNNGTSIQPEKEKKRIINIKLIKKKKSVQRHNFWIMLVPTKHSYKWYILNEKVKNVNKKRLWYLNFPQLNSYGIIISGSDSCSTLCTIWSGKIDLKKWKKLLLLLWRRRTNGNALLFWWPWTWREIR